MKFLNMEMNTRMALWLGMHGLIIIDIILITIAMLFSLPPDIAGNIQLFDFCVCIILLTEWSINFYLSKPKTLFLKQRQNWISLIASIPFDVLLPVIIPGIDLLRYLRLLKLLRLIVLFDRFFYGVEKFIKKTNMDIILGGVFFTVIIFTLLLHIYGSSYGLLDDFYFVMTTLTTVGYGDITPKTFNEKIIAIMLLIMGIFVFSTITAAISSYLIDRLSGEDRFVKEDVEKIIDERTEKVLEGVRKENEDLKAEIAELKEMIKDK